MEQTLPPQIDQAKNIPGRTVLVVRLMEDGTYIVAIPTPIQEAIQDMKTANDERSFNHFRDDMITSIRNLLDGVWSGKVQEQIAANNAHQA